MLRYGKAAEESAGPERCFQAAWKIWGTGNREREAEKRESSSQVLIPGKEGSQALRRVGANPSSGKIVPWML